MPSATPPELPNPWRAFLVDVDRHVPRPIEIHCLGGFVAACYCDLPRPTNDLDYIEAFPHDAMATLQEIAGIESPLAKKYRLHFQHVSVASLPESYAERLTGLFPEFRRLRLFTLEPHDLALSKLTRNSPIDRHDVAQLAKAVPLDAKVLRARYQRELRPIIIGDPGQHDRTLEMWIEAYVR
jgi:hypothetical protein